MVDGCGTICCHPKWLQKYARTRWFMVIYGFLGIIQSASYLYFIITLTTIEKRFKIPSQTTGIILSGNEISQILLSLILSYAGGQRNRPRWISWGVVCSALSCFVLAWPHFIYGAGEDALKLTNEYSSIQNVTTTGRFSETISLSIRNKLCQIDAKSDDCEEIFSYLPLFLIFLSQFVLGIGNTLYYALGQSYLDDNTHQEKTPLMFGYAYAMRMFGPVLGIGLAYVCLNIYINPSLTPIITKKDPRWLGAWWLGWILLGGLMFIFACFIGMFPKHLPKEIEERQTISDQEKCNRIFEVTGDSDQGDGANLKDFSSALMRLLKNKVIIFNNIAAIFYILGGTGFMTFMSRVMEVQFNRSSQGGTIISGPITIMGMVIGLLISGFYISKRKPLPKYLFFWNVIVGLISVCGSLTYANLGCDDGNTLMLKGSIRSCNENCFCDNVSYSPVCDNVTQETFFSPCHTGCMDYDVDNNVYTNCLCTESPRINNIQLLSTTSYIPPIIINNNDNNVVSRKISTTEFPVIHRQIIETDKNVAMNGSKSKIDERQTNLYDVYDDLLKPDYGPHDDSIDLTNEVNDDFDSNIKDSQEHLLIGDSDEEDSETISIMQKRHIENPGRYINHGACFSNCDFAFKVFTVISFTCSLLGSTGRIGNLLVNFRAVEPRDKSIAQGFTLFLTSLFALIPGPIIFGRIIDSTCLSWTYKCGRQGNCRLYDSIKFKQLLHYTSASFILIGVIFDFLVWYFGKEMELYGNDDVKKPNDSDESTEKEPLNE